MKKTNSKDYTALIVVAIALVLLFGVIIFFAADGDLSVLYWVLGIIAAILNICLFVKIWKMTNDVRELKEYFMDDSSKNKVDNNTVENTPTEEQSNVVSHRSESILENMSYMK